MLQQQKNLMFLDSAAKNYPGILRDQNKYDTFDMLARHVRRKAKGKLWMDTP